MAESMSKIKSPISNSDFSRLAKNLVQWYHKGHRDLPWRQNRDPYEIWISEIMLQQTTSQAVIPFYHRFLKKFPTLKKLSQAPIEEVYEVWAGLGYYSRARNILKAAQMLAKKQFPQTWEELIEYPGFGPYTARAVTSFAFGENVGVVDGNVIRILSRVFDLKENWWNTQGRNVFQTFSDSLVQSSKEGPTVNQAMMELGATICTPKSPTCLLCPWSSQCLALKNNTIDQRPAQKPRPSMEVLLWTPRLWIKNNKVAMIENSYAPFLKNSKIFPGSLKTLKVAPKTFDFKHTITRYQIYTQVELIRTATSNPVEWFDLTDFSKVFPYNLYKKTLALKK
jgi:A/G-specific adenine glycosylase